MSKLPKKTRDKSYTALGNHQKYISRITKTLYYGKIPENDELSLPVTELAAELFSEAKRGKSLDRLHCDDAVKISRNACVSSCSLILAVLYLEKLKKNNPEYLDRTSPSDLFLVSLMVSCKFLYDDGESDEVFLDEWAASGGVTTKQLVQLEKDFLKAMKWEIYVHEFAFMKKLRELERNLARKQGNARGFFTYTELENLLVTIEFTNFLQCVINASVIILAAYTAAVLTIFGSGFIVSQIPGTALSNTQLIPVETAENSTAIPKENTAVRLLKTGILLATVCNNSSNETSQEMSWDWWNVPAMTWLSETSKLLQFNIVPTLFVNFAETYVTEMKVNQLEDHINKATKTRLQDQMEHSWHKEWTDTFNINSNAHFYYVQYIKS